MNDSSLVSSSHQSIVKEAIQRIGKEPYRLIPLLQFIHYQYHYLPQDVMEELAQETGIPLERIYSVATFYNQFRLQPIGEHLVKVCVGTACHIKGSMRIVEEFRRCLNIPPEEDTDPQRQFTIETVGCLGCCTLAPVVVIDGETIGHVMPKHVPQLIQQALLAKTKSPSQSELVWKSPESSQQFLIEVAIGLGSCCMAGGAGKVFRRIRELAQRYHLPVKLKRVGCVGMCHRTPLLIIHRPQEQEPLCFFGVSEDIVEEIILRILPPQGWIDRWRHTIARVVDSITGIEEKWRQTCQCAVSFRDSAFAPFLGPQKHLVLEHAGQLDPLDLEGYKEVGGWLGLKEALQRNPREIILEITKSGLRGRGGAGFWTGKKWEIVANQEKTPKFIIMNGDEGDPGAFMDRMILESFPFRVLEGLLIAAWATGATRGFLYIREEYPLAIERITQAIDLAREQNYLGKNIMGSGWEFDVELVSGAGAFVCGEETALIRSISGYRGTPTLKPPFPAEEGLWGQPTLVQNVETLANVPWIIRHGAETFRKIGTPGSPGTKVFSLTGKIQRGGLIEIPMGITIHQILFDIGGGPLPGRRLKAVQIGGPSGGCLPISMDHLSVDFDSLAQHQAMMGSGGLVVLDDTDCMVDVACYFMNFIQRESCGQCAPCRIGTRRMLEILEKLCRGEGTPQLLQELETIAYSVRANSLCALGRTAPNPVLSTLRYFREEYLAHLEGICPAGKCVALSQYVITENCNGCTRCAQVCPVHAIPFRPHEKHTIDPSLCTFCDACRPVCPVHAILRVPKKRPTNVKER